MFSWKNIKTTISQKVVNAENNTEKALGVAEVLGKTIASGTTSLIKNMPSMASSMLDNAVKNHQDPDQRDKAREAQKLFDEKAKEIYESEKDAPNLEESELEKYENRLLEIQNKIKQNDEYTKRLDTELEKIENQLTSATEEEKLELKSKRSKLLESYKVSINDFKKLLKKEALLERIIDDYKFDN